MKFFTILAIVLSSVSILLGQTSQTWYKVQFDDENVYLQILEKAGEIEAEPQSPGVGWMTENNYRRYASRFELTVIEREKRPVVPLRLPVAPDSIGQVLATYPLPPQVESVRGFGYDGQYFYIADAEINNEKVHKLDPNNNFNVVRTYPAPGTSPLPWGVASDGKYVFLADAIYDLIFKLDTSLTIISSFPTGGPIATGLGYRQGELWNADLGQFSPPVPAAVYKSDTLGNLLATYVQGNSVNGVAAHDSAVFISHNAANGKNIIALDPQTFTPLFSFPSPLDYPNGLAFDGRYLWVCGLNQGVGYIMQIDIGVNPPQPPQINFNNFDLVADGMFNNRFNAAFDSQGNVHIAYATQFETVSSTKEIMYATNKSGVWELFKVTDDALIDELPVIRVDGNDVVHIMWNGYVQAEGDVELFYTNNGSGEFVSKIQITSKLQDGIDGHTWPDFMIDNNGVIHFTFSDSPLGAPEVYYATYSQGTTSAPVDVSLSSAYDSDPRMVLDDQEYPHVFWNNATSGLGHATNAGGSWQAQFITSMGLSRPAAAADGQGIIHFVVTDGPLVKYGNNMSGNFAVTDTIAIHAADCYYPQLAVDKADMLHLAYHSFGDSVNTWPGNGEIFYSNNALWNAKKFPKNISQLPDEQEIYPGIAATDTSTLVVGWAKTGFSKGVFSDIRMATTLPDSGGFLAGKVNTSEDYHHFGFIAPLDSGYWSFTIRNSGTRTLTVSDLVWDTPYSPWFDIETDFVGPQMLEWGDSLTVNVTAIINTIVDNDTVLLDGTLAVMSDDPVEPAKNILFEVLTEPVGIGSEPGAAITRNGLYGNYPNPFNPTTTIHFSLAAAERVKLQIFNTRGQMVRTLAAGKFSQGMHSVTWDGRNSEGILQASGVYFYRLQIGDGFVKTNRMLLLK
jgi:hypothetical protein